MASTRSRVVVPDTSIYVGLLRHGHFRDALLTLPFLVRNSAVVLSELRRGATRARERRFIDELEGNHPVFAPGLWEWRRAGELLERMRRSHGYDAPKLRDLHFDVLIALTARAVGATVVTANRADFETIREHERFELIVWKAT